MTVTRRGQPEPWKVAGIHTRREKYGLDVTAQENKGLSMEKEQHLSKGPGTDKHT